MLAVRPNNIFLALLVKIKALVAYAVSKNYVVVALLIILSYTAYSQSIVDCSPQVPVYQLLKIKKLVLVG